MIINGINSAHPGALSTTNDHPIPTALPSSVRSPPSQTTQTPLSTSREREPIKKMKRQRPTSPTHRHTFSDSDTASDLSTDRTPSSRHSRQTSHSRSLRRIKDRRKRGREKQQSFSLSQRHSLSHRKSKSTRRAKRTSLPFMATYSDSSSYESGSSSSDSDAPPDPVTIFKRKLKKRFPGFKGEWTEVSLPPQTRDELFAEAAPTIQALRIRTQFIPPDEIPDEVRSVQDHLLKMSAQSSLVCAALLSNLYAEAARQGNSTLLPQIIDIILLTADAASRTHYSRYLKKCNLQELMDRFDVPQRAGITVNQLPPPPDSYVPPIPHPEHQLQMVAPTVISHMNSGGNFSSRGGRGRAPVKPNGQKRNYGRFGN
ncbi:Golgi Complex-Associated Protein of 16kDa [Blattamonas nauphoetae]|uniref:Golgi Complex-Associated Protein of 16kDa n=1 Tax=Blattamonas nauphoetae TaxID=2049346 RepID=A0ABQ9X8J1_9EUKA|nr:Golgi Complex-Associated Protein of 16kDa [Blattamonas nauphoetae]